MMQGNGSRLPFVFLGIVGIVAAIALLLYLPKPKEPQEPVAENPPATGSGSPEAPKPDPLPEIQPDPDPPVEDPTTVLKETGVIKPGDPDPHTLLEKIGRALEAGDMMTAERLIGQGVLPPAQSARLSELAAGTGIRLRSKNPVREVGELEFNKLSRWALELESEGLERILFDLRRNQERWMVERMTLPEGGKGPPRASLADALELSDMFIQALMRLDFESARLFVDDQKVSDAKIAALCILFEEGGYKLRQQKPLRRLFERSDTAGFLANMVALNGDQAAQFGITMQRPDAKQAWRVSEINLDALLADYAQRVAGGDVYYTPLVSSPQGGDTLVLYFEFDEEGLTDRAGRQLEIVARILLSDETKKLTISGHTDALGTDNYNDTLSSRRATTVRDYLADAGVPAEQIVTVAKGKSQPRRPNVLEDGTDNPLGRRANRRTEIYLDF